MEITELLRRGKSELYKTYVDGNYCCLLQAEVIVKNKIKVGATFNQDEFLKIREESDELTCKTLGLDYISNGPKTRKQVFDHLKQKGYLPVSINKALDTLCSYGYISDKYYAEMFVKSKQEQKGKMYIKSALKQKGVSDSIIKEVLEDFESDEDCILVLANKFLKNKKDDGKLKEKLYRHLLGKGFEYGEVLKVCNKIFKESID